MLKRIIAWTCLALAFLGPPVAFAPSPALAQGYIGTLAQPPAWVTPGASIDCDWQNQRFYNCAYDTTFSHARASAETCTNANGVLTYAAAGLPCSTFAGLQIWESRINSFLRSGDLTNASWSPGNCTIASSAVLGPDNVNTLQVITATAAGNRMQQIVAIGASTITISAIVAPNSASAAGLVGHDGAGANGAGAIYTLTGNGVVVGTVTNGSASASSGTITKLANGTYRITLTYTTVVTSVFGGVGISDGSTYNLTIFPSATSGTLYASYLQMEVGSFASPYIPTTTTGVARAADSVSVQGALFSLLQLPSVSIVAKLGAVQSSLISSAVVVVGAPTANQAPLFFGTTTTEGGIGNGSVNLFSTGGGDVTTAARRLGVSWAPGARTAAIGGGATATDTNSQTVDTVYRIGSRSGSAQFVDTNINRIIFYNSKIPDGQLQSLANGNW